MPSEAATLAKWAKLREADVARAREALATVRTLSPRSRAVGLLMVHNAIAFARYSSRMVTVEAGKLSLCAMHRTEKACTCVAPF